MSSASLKSALARALDLALLDFWPDLVRAMPGGDREKRRERKVEERAAEERYLAKIKCMFTDPFFPACPQSQTLNPQ